MSLNIKCEKNGNETVAVLEGRLDTVTAPELEAELKKVMPETDALVLEMEGLEYISSAGLRVLLVAQKEMSRKKGSMKLRHVNEMVGEVLEMTGFNDILTIE